MLFTFLGVPFWREMGPSGLPGSRLECNSLGLLVLIKKSFHFSFPYHQPVSGPLAAGQQEHQVRGPALEAMVARGLGEKSIFLIETPPALAVWGTVQMSHLLKTDSGR